MSFELGKATRVSDAKHIRMVASAFRKQGKPVVLVPLKAGVHAGHLSLIRAAKSIRGAVVIVAYSGRGHEQAKTTAARDAGTSAAASASFTESYSQDIALDIAMLERAGVDAVFEYTEESLWPRGLRTTILPVESHLESPEYVGREIAWVLALVGVVGPSHVIVGEKDYEVLVGLQRAVNELHIPVKLQGVPTVRTPEGIPMSLRNAWVAPEEREAVAAMSAALTAGAYAAEGGAEKVLEATHAVLEAAGVEPEYVELRGLDLGPAPEQGDARLFVAVEVRRDQKVAGGGQAGVGQTDSGQAGGGQVNGGQVNSGWPSGGRSRDGYVRVMDNVGMPLGIGFKNIEAHQEARQEARQEAN